MYNMYHDLLTENESDIQPVSDRFYRDIFNTEFNIGFEAPYNDTCTTCDLINNAIKSISSERDQEDIVRLQEEKRVHLALQKEVHTLLKQSKLIQDPTVGVLCFDLQQTLPTPKLSSGRQFYKRKVWTYNFCIHNIKTGEATMYLWNETQGKRGSAEIARCLQHYISNYLDLNVKYLKLFSDNCPGQNKNINMVLACLQQIHEGRFNKIEHFFMIPGHSYLPCDRDFGHIEKKIKEVEVFSQPNYATIIEASRRTNPFKVINMEREWFLDIEVLQTWITNRSRTGAIFSNGKVFIFDENYKQGFGIKATYNQLDVTNVKLQKGRLTTYNSHLFNLATIRPPIKYETPVKLTEMKLEDIKTLLPLIPPEHRSFMDDLIAEQEGLTDMVYVDDHDPDDDFIDYE